MPAFSKKGLFPDVSDHQARPELEVARRVRWLGRPVILPLSEGQVSEHKGAALMLDALPSRQLLGDKGMTPTGSARHSPCVALRHAFRRSQTARCRLRMIALSSTAQDREHVRQAAG